MSLGRNLKKAADEAARKAKEQARQAARSSPSQKKTPAAGVKSAATQAGRRSTQAASAKKTSGTQQTRRATPASSVGRNVGQQVGEKVRYYSNKGKSTQGLVKDAARNIGRSSQTGQPAKRNTIGAVKSATDRMIGRAAPQMSARLDQKLNLVKQQNELLRLTRRSNALSGLNRYQDELYGVKTPWPSYMSRPAQRELTAAEQAEITRLEGVIESLRVPMQNSGTVRTKEGVTWGVSGPSSWEQVGPDAVKWHDETVAELQKQIDDIKSRAYETTTPRYYSLRNKTPLDVLKADGWTKLWSGKTMSENAQELRDTRPREQVQREIVRGAKDKFTNALRNAAISQEKVSSYDKENLSPDQLRSVQEAKYYYRRGATQEERDAQHMNAEQVRAGQGYSGGVSGDKYISPEVPFEVRKQLNDDGIIAWKQAEMKRQKAVTEDEIAKADAQKQEVLDTPAYRKYNRAKEALSAIGNRVGGSWVGLGETTNAMMNADFEADVEKRWGDVSLQTLVVRHKKAQEALEEFDRNIAEKGYDPQGRNRVVLQNDVLSLEAALDRRMNPQKYRDLTTVSPDSLGQRMTRAAQEHTENATRGLGTVGQYAMQAAIMTGEVLPTMALAPLSGGGSLTAMGLQAAGSRMNELNARGIAPAESFSRGGLSGVSAALSERIPLERLGKLLKGQTGRNIVFSVLGNIGIEIGTEEADNIANTIMDYAYRDPEAKWSWEDIRDTAILTAMSSGILNVPAAVAGRFSSGQTDISPSRAADNEARPANQSLQEQREDSSPVGETSVTRRSPSSMQMTQSVDSTAQGAVDLTRVSPAPAQYTQQGQDLEHDGRSQLQVSDITARTTEQADTITQAQDAQVDARTEMARQLRADSQAYNEMKRSGALSSAELAMVKESLDARLAQLVEQQDSSAQVSQAPQVTQRAQTTAQDTQVPVDFPPVQWQRSGFPPSSFIGSLIDAARENNARNKAAEQLRADQEAFRAQQAERAILARHIDSLGNNGQKAIMSVFQPGGDSTGYWRGFTQAYTQARQGVPEAQIQMPAGLTMPQFYAAVQSGLNDRAADVQAQNAAGSSVVVSQRRQTDAVSAHPQAGFQADKYARAVLDANGVKMLDGYGRITGTRIRFVDQSEMDNPWSRGEIVGNEIRLSRQRVRNSQDAAVFVAGHEITHRMQDMGVSEYNDLVDYVMGMEEYAGKVDAIIRGYAARDVPLSRTEAIDEVVADFVGETILDTESLRDFIARNAGNRSLLERFLDAVRELASKLTGREKAQVDEAVRLLESALRSAKQKTEEMSKAASDATETRNSIEIGRDDVAALRGIDRKSINDFTSAEIKQAEKWARKFYEELGTKSPFFRAWFGDWRALSNEPVTLPEIDRNATPASGNTVNQDTGRKMSWDRDTMRESVLNASKKDQGDMRVIVANMKEIVKNAVLLDTVVSTPGSKRKMSGTAFMHSFYTVAPVDGRQVLVKMFAEEALSGRTGEVFTRAYSLKAIKIVAGIDNGVLPQKGMSGSHPATVNSVADLFALVKQYDKAFHPRESSQVVNEDGTPKVVYHGTLANGLDAFRKDYIGSRNAADDVGFFFTSRESIAEDYAMSEFDSETRGEVIPAYLDIKNPLVFDSRFGKANGYGNVFRDNDVIDVWDNFQGAILDELEGQDYDGIILDDGTDQMYVAFEPTQIKSATENTGTFDREDSKIRYSLVADDDMNGKTVRYSLAGTRARTADKSLLHQAEALEKQGAENEEIRQQTGWFRGMDGKWRFEIDDSQAVYHWGGDASFRRDHPEYQDYQSLMQRLFEGDGLSEEEHKRLRGLDEIWGREYGRLSERTQRGNATLGDILEHDALFAAYPELRDVRILFKDMLGGGRYEPGRNAIILDKYDKAGREGALLHEIQHAIQEIEGFTPGASQDYWQSRREEYPDRTAGDLYRNTAGEIEARDVARRQAMTAGERKKTAWKLGGEDTVFAERNDGGKKEKRYLLDQDDQGRELSDQQKQYFRDSKIRDRDGNLMTVYHGTGNRFTVFDLGRSGEVYDGWSELGPGLYFTPDKKLAQYFADNAAWGGKTHIMEGYVNITNPFNIMRDVPFSITDLQAEYDLSDFDVRFLTGAGYRLINFLNEHDINTMNYLKAKGYDGIWNPDHRGEPSQVVAFTSKAFKLATNTTPTGTLDIRYSLDGGLEEARLMRENQKLRDKLEFWRHQVKRTDRTRVEPSQVQKLAKKLARGYSSSMDVKDVASKLQDIYDGIGSGWTYDQARDAAADLAHTMVEQAAETDGYLYYAYEPMRKFFREHALVLSPTDRGQITDYNDWRKSQMGKLKIQHGDQSNIDVLFKEAAEMWPEFFDEERDVSSLDQLERIVEVMEDIYSQEDYNPYGDDLAAPAGYLTREILDGFWDVPAIKKTYADRMQERLDRQKNMTAAAKREAKERESALKEQIAASRRELAEAGRDLRAAQREARATGNQAAKDIESLEKKVERLEKKLREEQGKARWVLAESRLLADWQKASAVREQERRVERYQKALSDTRQARDAQIKRMKEDYLGRRKAASERQQAREMRGRIIRHSKDLTTKLLRPSDAKHIPAELQTAVAKLLESINLESKFDVDPTTGKRVARGEGLATKRTKAFQAVRDQFSEIADSEEPMVIDPNLFGDSGEGIKGNFEKVLDMYDTPLSELSLDQLQTVWDTIRSIEYAIRSYGRTLEAGKYERITDWVKAIFEEAKTRRPMKSHGLIQDLMTPFTFFSQYGASGLAVYRMMRDAQDREQYMVDQIKGEAAKIVGDDKAGKKLIKDWNTKRHQFTVEWTETNEDGTEETRSENLTLTTAQIMDLYNLSKRPQAQDHILKGGVVQPEIKTGGKKIERGSNVIHLDETSLNEIIGTLTEEQRRVADQLQKLTTGILAKWGNEASMKAYGYEKFRDPNYWSIRTAKEGIYSNAENNRENAKSLKNTGMAKSTVPHASNALDIMGVFDNFSRHSMEMVKYSAWLTTIEDVERIYNYKFRDGAGKPTGQTMKHLLDKVGGKGSQTYWSNLVTDIQNGIKNRSRTWYGKTANKIIGNAKGAAVGMNARVVIQQPTAYMRAFAVMNPADLIAGIAGAPTKGSGWSKAKKYAGIAARKAAGGFDVTANPNQTIFEQKTFLQWLSDKSGALAGWADAITWRALWNAAEWQVSRENPELVKGSDDYYRKAAEIFTETVDQTQVVDGVMQRSQIMRDSNEIVKQATAFMGESIMSMNLVFRTFNNYRYQQDPKKRTAARKAFARATTAFVTTCVVNALAQSVVDGIRDDDKDRKYLERLLTAFIGTDFENAKYMAQSLAEAISSGDESESPFLERLTEAYRAKAGEDASFWGSLKDMALDGNVIDNMNPLNSLPFLSDLMSMLQGYDVTRADADVMADVLKAGRMFIESWFADGKYSREYAMVNLLAQTGKLFGIPGHTIIRDVTGALRSYAVESDNIPFLYELEKVIYSNTSDKNKSNFLEIAWAALLDGDLDTFDRIREDLMEGGIIDGKKMDEAMKKKVREQQQENPAFTLGQTIMDLLGIVPKYDLTADEEEEKFDATSLTYDQYEAYAQRRGELLRAGEDEVMAMDAFNNLDDSAKDSVVTALYSYAEKVALEECSNGQYEITDSTVNAMREAADHDVTPAQYAMLKGAMTDIGNAKTTDGEDIYGSASYLKREAMEETGVQLSAEGTSFMYEKLKISAEVQDLSESEFQQALADIHEQEKGASKYSKYGTELKDTVKGLYEFKKNVRADKDASGKTINGSAKAKVVEEIRNAPGLTNAQRREIYLDMGYAAKDCPFPA